MRSSSNVLFQPFSGFGFGRFVIVGLVCGVLYLSPKRFVIVTKIYEMVSFSSLTTVLENKLPTFRLNALVVLEANEAKGVGDLNLL